MNSVPDNIQKREHINTISAALFYPSFHLEENWAKVALLYWDSLARIVPKQIEHEIDQSNPTAATLASENLLVNIDPADYVDMTARRFDEYLVPLFENDPNATFDAKHVSELLVETAKIHPLKLADTLRADLLQMGVEHQEDGFLSVPEKLGGPYMLCLGTVMGERLGVPLVTDDPAFERLGEYFSFSVPPTQDSAKHETVSDPAMHALFRLGLPMPTRNQLWNVPLDKVLRFRKKYEPERVSLRIAVDGVVAEAAKISDPNKMKLFWKKKKTEVDAAIMNYQRSMGALNLMALSSLFKVSGPTGVSTAILSNAGWLGAMPAMVLTGAAFAVDAAGWLGNRQFRKQQTDQKCPMALLA